MDNLTDIIPQQKVHFPSIFLKQKIQIHVNKFLDISKIIIR